MNQTVSGMGSTTFKIDLGRTLFSDPRSERHNSVVVTNGAAFDDGIDVGDLVAIDFTANRINSDGLYVITLNDSWIGYRRFQYIPKLHLIDNRGNPEVTPEILKTIKVVGRVIGVYKKAII